VPSKSEARRLIVQGGVEINEQKFTDANAASVA
jgi:tyrosyl-tRNA synthetase